jgi:hypothetical protein
MRNKKFTYEPENEPLKEWFEYNDLFLVETLPFWKVLEIADNIFDSYKFHSPKLQMIEGLITVTIELEVEWGYPFKSSIGIASRELERKGNRYNMVSAATYPAMVLSVAKKNAMQKLCNLLGRKKDIIDEVIEKKKDNKLLN